MEADVKYFRRRAGEEREAAMKAANPTARQAHLAMAERYAERAAVALRPTLNGNLIGVA